MRGASAAWLTGLGDRLFGLVPSTDVPCPHPNTLQARSHAKPEKTEDVAAFLESALEDAEAEAGTTTWFALRLDETTFGIFDTFPDEDARQAHLDGEIAAELMDCADELFQSDPEIDHIEVLAAKHP